MFQPFSHKSFAFTKTLPRYTRKKKKKNVNKEAQTNLYVTLIHKCSWRKWNSPAGELHLPYREALKGAMTSTQRLVWLQCSGYCGVYLTAYFLLILPGFSRMDTSARLPETLASPQWHLSFRSLRYAWCAFPLLFARLLSAACSQGEEWDQRFHTVSRDLNKWSSSKTIFPHLSPARGFICLVICCRVSRLTGATDDGK